MPVTIENMAPCRKRLRIEVPAERVADARTEILRTFRKQASIPGFRPGKAPEPMVEKRFGKEIDDEVRQRLIPDSYRESLSEQNLKALGYPKIEDVSCERGQPLVYHAVIDTPPEFKLPDYKGIPVKRQDAAVTDEDVDKALDTMREHQADYASVDRAIQVGDFAIVNYSGVVEGKPITELVPDAKNLGEQKDFWLSVQADGFLPGFCDQLTGGTKGEKCQVQVDFPADFPQPVLAGKKATYFVDINDVREKKLPELTEEFAKKLGAESLEKLKADLRQGLEKEREQEIRGDQHNQIIDHLLGQVEFELPESLVAEETKGIVYDLVRENSMRGASKEQLEEQKDNIYAAASETAKRRVRVSFLLQAIAEAEKIEVEESEMEERIAQMAERYRVTPARLRAQLSERNRLDEIEEQILVGKTLDMLLANAKVETSGKK